MNRFIRNALAALVVATAGVAATAPAANASGIGFELSIGGPGGAITVHDRDRRGGWGRDHGRGHGWDRGGACRPHQAVNKARDMGVRRADVVRAGRGRVVVEGFRHHRPVRVVFANERHCPVIGFRR
ncbi:hypothetical protein [Hoeflea olei]|uniref:Antifreeze protein n=1 Tax=Hoeflea olei TaxID=1480615 RepID=A0A1C1YUM7_9HYPH|nr:hypothetical protein [Hoeflea olei]OCW57233.1 hypothetical protein AWJ14_13030 [Hoeflea olei]